MSLAISHALVRFVVQGFGLGLVVLLARPALRRLDAGGRFAVLFAALLSAPALVLWNLLQLPGGLGVPGPTPRWSSLVTHGWLLGVGLSGCRTALELHGLHRLRATGLPLRGLHDRLAALAERLGVRRPVAVVESPAVHGPMVLGWVRPMILLPLGLATRLPPDWLDAILAHELAHLRRHDYALRLVQRAVEILLFFHPVVWWLAAQLDHAREEACDDLVVDRMGDPLVYARALTELASLQPTPALAPGATRGNLMSRIRHIVQRSKHSRPLHRWWQAVAVAATMSVAGYGLAHVAEAAEQSRLHIAWMPASVSDFEPEILAAAQRHGVDPDLLAIVVLVESRGNPTVRSPAGARGLMQLMPKTAAEIAAARGLEGHHPDRLDDPAYNLDLGAWYLAQQLGRFGERLDTEDDVVAWAAAAYNGGPTLAEAAQRGEAELSEETTRYQERVRTMWSERRDPKSSLLK